ncbi:MAG: hypothetical protein IPM82_11975 [Saprospiraceae bacterium]|nr:hypothetical protein [Saprospiraceae bacterium]
MEDGIQVMFSLGKYCPGDHWSIPARTATGEVEWPPYIVPNNSPKSQLPHGTDHFYCKLAIMNVSGGIVSVQDCRPLFPALTELPDNDLREHNKYLHGYGVVCGFKMKCLPKRGNGVQIGSGYALDCEGDPIKADQSIVYDFLSDKAVKKNWLEEKKGSEVFACPYLPELIIGQYFPLSLTFRKMTGTIYWKVHY